MELKLKTIMSDVLGVSIDDINDETSMKSLKKWDSLRHMDLVLAIEESFELPRLSMDDIVAMISVASIKEILQAKGIEI